MLPNVWLTALFDCGTRKSIGTTLSIGGKQTRPGEVPWHAGIYSNEKKEYNLICGGSLVSSSFVLSAAHCFWNYFQGELHAPHRFAVAVGKVYRAWGDARDHLAQKSDVKEVHLPEFYQGGEANEQADLALVRVKSLFQFTDLVRPVCFDLDAVSQGTQLQPGNVGMVAGWGLTTADGNVSDILKVVDLPYVSAQTCISGSPGHFRGHITVDKICAGYRNRNTALCQGDSGGGLVFLRSNVGTERYFLRGIVSNAPLSVTKAECNANAYITFTQLLVHEHFINTHWDSGAAANETAPHDDTEWDWSRCVEERVPNLRRIEDAELHPLSAATRTGPGGELILKVSFRGDKYFSIYLSQKPQLDDNELYYEIEFYKKSTKLSVNDGVNWNELRVVDNGANFSPSRDLRFTMSIANDTLEVRVGATSTLLLDGQHPRFNQIQYFGFITEHNTIGYGLFKYGC